MKAGRGLDAWNELALEIVFRVLLRLRASMQELQLVSTFVGAAAGYPHTPPDATRQANRNTDP